MNQIHHTEKLTDGEPVISIEYEELRLSATLLRSWESNMRHLRELPCRRGDILLCSYPKCGTHWMKALVTAIVRLRHGVRSLEDRSLGDRTTGARSPGTLLELTPAEDLRAASGPRLLVSHLSPRRLPTALWSLPGCRVVLTARNPKDAAVSLFHHVNRSAVSAGRLTWPDFYRAFLAGTAPFAAYLDYLTEWHELIKATQDVRNTSSVKVVYFEELKKDYFQTVKALSRYLGTVATDDDIRTICDDCSLEKLRHRTNREGDHIHPSLQGRDGNSVIFRNGVVGDWKNYFTVAQSEQFDTTIAARLKNTSFDFDYD